jgi:hypothetical protein
MNDFPDGIGEHARRMVDGVRRGMYTPGPWIADDFCMLDDRLVRVGTTDGSSTYYHNSKTICECVVRDEDADQSEPHVVEAEANARLIARSPAMDNALRNCLLLAMRNLHREKSEDWSAIMRFCREAGVEPSPLRETP